ncbi:MAG TPA: SUMF1/EgtB/PvdO family nonheme iron enzyme, partial [Candidatus Limnocylindrales bacterium]|nr:SUMF1/EgtB/PvdO family nonheme iron enzyme [Candidatus Limnocylindrales bacterium]
RENLSQKEMRRAIIDFGEKLRVGDVALFYFAGHGLQVAGRNYMVPVDAEIASEVEVEVESVDVATVLVRMETVRTRVNIVILDACRDNPFAHRFKPSVRGLASIDAPAGTLIAYATAPGKVARDGAAGGNGLYTGELVKAIGAPGLRIEDVFKRVRQAVQREAQGEQVPWESSSLVGNFTFVPSKAAASTKTARPAQGSSRLEVREEHREVGTLALTSRIPGVEVWVDEQRVGTMREGAALIVDNLSAGAHRIRAKKDGRRDWAREVKIVAGQRTEVSVDPAPAAASAVPRPDDAGAQVLVAAGEFMMGSTREEVEQAVEQCRALGRQAVTCRRLHENELPRRPVTLDAFHIDRDEVTNARFERFVASTDYRTRAEQQGWSTVYRDIDGKWLGERVAGAAWQTPRGAGSAAEPAHPVVHVSWSEADTYCRWVGRRLPSEAEWEKAARGPTPRSFPWGDVWSGSRANARRATAAGGTVPVGQNQEGASPYGVRDMAGNVWEWVADWLDTQYYRRAPDRNPPGPERGEQRVKRGGAWDSSAVNVRTMRRGSADPTTHDNMTGFRCARSAS